MDQSNQVKPSSACDVACKAQAHFGGAIAVREAIEKTLSESTDFIC